MRLGRWAGVGLAAGWLVLAAIVVSSQLSTRKAQDDRDIISVTLAFNGVEAQSLALAGETLRIEVAQLLAPGEARLLFLRTARAVYAGWQGNASISLLEYVELRGEQVERMRRVPIGAIVDWQERRIPDAQLETY